MPMMNPLNALLGITDARPDDEEDDNTTPQIDSAHDPYTQALLAPETPKPIVPKVSESMRDDFPQPDYSRRNALLAELEAKRNETRWPLAGMQRTQQHEIDTLRALLNDEDRFVEQDYAHKVSAFNARKAKTSGGIIYAPDDQSPTGWRAKQSLLNPYGEVSAADLGPAGNPFDIRAKAQRDVQQLRNEGNYDVAGERGDAQRDVAKTRAGAYVTGQNIRAGAAKYGADQALAGRKYVSDNAPSRNVDVDRLDLNGVRAALLSVRQAKNAQIRSAVGPDPQILSDLSMQESQLQDREQKLLSEMRARPKMAPAAPTGGAPAKDPLGILGPS